MYCQPYIICCASKFMYHASFSESLEMPPESCSSFHVWFQVECIVDAAPPDHTMMVSCPTLSSTVAQLSVVNPYSYQLKFQVHLACIIMINVTRMMCLT